MILEDFFISKIFIPHCDQLNRCYNKENLKYALNEEFKMTYIQVHQQLYDEEIILQNNALFFLYRMVYIEVILKNVKDWRTIKTTPKMKRCGTNWSSRRYKGNFLLARDPICPCLCSGWEGGACALVCAQLHVAPSLCICALSFWRHSNLARGPAITMG